MRYLVMHEDGRVLARPRFAGETVWWTDFLKAAWEFPSEISAYRAMMMHSDRASVLKEGVAAARVLGRLIDKLSVANGENVLYPCSNN